MLHLFLQKRFYYRVATPFTRKPLLAETSYPYYDRFRSLKKEMWLSLSSNLGREGKKALCYIRQYYATIDILLCYLYYSYEYL